MQNVPRVGCRGTGVPPAAAGQAPGSPRLDSAVDGNWTQECTDRNPGQDRSQDTEQGPLEKAATDEESETLMIPQL